MENINLAIGLIGFLTAAVFMATWRLLKNRSATVVNIAAAIILIGLLVYIRFVWGQLWIVKWIPLSSVIVLSNWFPIFLGALGAAVWVRLSPQAAAGHDENAQDSEALKSATTQANLRRLPIMAVLLIGAVYSVMVFVPREPPECGNEWQYPLPPLEWPLCMQTTPNTCSAASAATLLNSLGIQATEQEMARLSLTRSGTTWLGLYHGLTTMLQGTGVSVEFFQGTAEDLQQLPAWPPMLLCCVLEEEAAEQYPRLVTEGGWIPRMAHTVVYFGSLQGYSLIGDPATGYEGWTEKHFELLWSGEGIRVVLGDQSNPQLVEPDDDETIDNESESGSDI